MIKNKLLPYQYFILLFLISLLIYVVGVLRVKSIFWGDSLYYYAYTRSIVIDHDLDFSNQAYDLNLGFPNPAEISEKTGLITNKFSPGTSIAWIPGFLLGQAISYLSNSFYNLLGYSYPGVFFNDGTGVITQFFVAVSALLFSIFGLWYLFLMIEDIFSRRIAYLSILTIFLTTQIFYYTSMDPVNSHSISFLLSTLLIYQFNKVLRKGISWQKVIPMGITAGFLILVRNQDVAVALPILLILLVYKNESFLNKLNWFTLYAGSAFVIFSIQLYTTLTLFGVLGSPYLIRGEKLSWFKPDLFRVLFTLENGLFFFSPVLIYALLALFRYLFINITNLRSPKKSFDTPLFILVVFSLVSFLLQLYIVASWGPEIIGGPYGTRMFVSMIPHLSIGLALLIKFLQERFSNRKFWFIYSVFNILMFINITAQTIYMLYRF